MVEFAGGGLHLGRVGVVEEFGAAGAQGAAEGFERLRLRAELGVGLGQPAGEGVGVRDEARHAMRQERIADGERGVGGLLGERLLVEGAEDVGRAHGQARGGGVGGDGGGVDGRTEGILPSGEACRTGLRHRGGAVVVAACGAGELGPAVDIGGDEHEGSFQGPRLSSQSAKAVRSGSGMATVSDGVGKTVVERRSAERGKGRDAPRLQAGVFGGEVVKGASVARTATGFAENVIAEQVVDVGPGTRTMETVDIVVRAVMSAVTGAARHSSSTIAAPADSKSLTA